MVVSNSDNAGVIAPPPLIALMALLLGLLLDWLLPAYVLTVLLPAHERMIIVAVLMIAGAVFAIAALRAFRFAGTHAEPWKPSLHLVTTGIFRWLRNPMYVGGTLLLIGIAVALASDWMLVTIAASSIVLHFGVVKREERYLEAKFGDGYRAYKKKVSRYGWPA